jgi:predicted TIM-barrel fold metal-dependent hydrolase
VKKARQRVIIDCHCHAGKGDGLTGPWDTAAPLEKYKEWAMVYGITHTILFAAFHSDYGIANRDVAAIVAKDRARYTGFAFVHAERDRGRVRELVTTAVNQYGFRGIKVHRHDARISREICDVARAFGVPILYDPMGEVSVVHLVASEYPDVRFIIPHLGSFADDWRAQAALIPMLAQYRNVYTDTSGIRRFDLLEEAVRRAGPGKVLFGSDGPWLHPGVELEKVRALRLSADAERLVLSGNIMRLLSGVKRHPLISVMGSDPITNLHAPRAADPWALPNAAPA